MDIYKAIKSSFPDSKMRTPECVEYKKTHDNCRGCPSESECSGMVATLINAMCDMFAHKDPEQVVANAANNIALHKAGIKVDINMSEQQDGI